MAVYLNKSSGLLEQVDAPQPGVHEYPLVSPDGEIGSAPEEHYQQLLSEGYRAPSSDEIKKELSFAKHSTGVEQAKTFGEGLASGTTFGFSTAIEQGMGVKAEDINARRETNPGMHAMGEVASLAVPGIGSASNLGRVGKIVTSGMSSKIRSGIARAMVENAMFQASDEVSKAFAADPHQSIQSAASNIGLSAFVGGAIGGGSAIAEPLWKVTQGSKLGEMVTKLKDQAQNTTGAIALDDMAADAGIVLSPEMRASMSGNPIATHSSQSLFESASKSGQKLRQEGQKFYQDVSDQAVSALGRTTKDIENVGELSDYEAGQQIKTSLEQELRAMHSPISEQFDKVSERFKATPVSTDALDALGEKIHNISIEEGHALRSGSDAGKEINSVLKDLPNIKTLEDMRKFQSSVREDLVGKGLYNLNRQVIGAFRDVEDRELSKVLGAEAPELASVHAEARQGYRDLSNKIEALNDRLRVGKYHGPEGFMKNLGEMAPEDVLRRLKGANDVDLQKLLTETFPGAAQKIKDAHLSQVFNKAANAPRALEGGIDPKVLFKEIQKMSPEMRAFALPEGAEQKLEALQGLVNSLPDRINPSGTARALDDKSVMGYGGVGAIVSALTTGNPLTGFITGALGRYLGREVPDAIKLALLKTLGKDGAVSGEAFRAAVQVAENAYKAAAKTNNVVKGVFGPAASEILPKSKEQIDKLDKQIMKVGQDGPPERHLEAMGHVGTILPDHAEAAGTFTTQALSYLASVRPRQDRQAPLDPKRVPSAVEQGNYDRALQIAENPLIAVAAVRDGSLTPQDVQTLMNVYPALYNSYKERFMEGLMAKQASGGQLPYKTILGLSLFMGTALESSVLPHNILMNQQVALPPAPAPGAPPGASSAKLEGLKGIPQASATPSQSRGNRLNNRK